MIPPDTKLLFILKYLRAELELLQLHPDYNDLIDDGLMGLCALSAGRTQYVLTKLGYNVVSVLSKGKWSSHCYCVLNNNTIIDLTATQFDKEEIYIAEFDDTLEDKSDPWYQPDRQVFDSHEELKDFLYVMGWTKRLIYNSSSEVKIRDFCALNGVKFVDDTFINSISKFYINKQSLSLNV